MQNCYSCGILFDPTINSYNRPVWGECQSCNDKAIAETKELHVNQQIFNVQHQAAFISITTGGLNDGYY